MPSWNFGNGCTCQQGSVLAEADECQVLASYRAGVLEPWLDLASQELLHKSIMCLYNSIKSCLPHLCQAVRCTFHLWWLLSLLICWWQTNCRWWLVEEAEGEVSVALAVMLEQCLCRWQLLVSPGTQQGHFQSLKLALLGWLWATSGPGWMRLWAAWPSGRCPCLQQGWNKIFKVLPIPSHSVTCDVSLFTSPCAGTATSHLCSPHKALCPFSHAVQPHFLARSVRWSELEPFEVSNSPCFDECWWPGVWKAVCCVCILQCHFRMEYLCWMFACADPPMAARGALCVKPPWC